jgi:para-aminobenzoate synthetase/4-amino-4-deoxychorismate lyase
VAVAAEQHLERLGRSAQELYAVTLPSALPALLQHAALEQGGPCRIRVLLRPDGDVRLEAAPLPAPGAPVALEPIALPGGLGAHKWRDRRLVDAWDAAVAPAIPLLVDLDGRILETTRASVFAFRDGTLITPPLDGSILPGVTRARTLAEAAALRIATAERPLTLDQLVGAEAVLTSGALRGLEPVTAIGSVLLAPLDDRLTPLVARLSAGQRR